MSQPYLSEIRVFPYPNLIPRGWAQCNGQLLPINQNQALFSLLGTVFGGNGTTNFGLPDLRGRTMLHLGPSPASGINYTEGLLAGVENVTLLQTQIPAHTHVATAFSAPATNAASTTSKMAQVKNTVNTNDAINTYLTGNNTAPVNLEPRTIGAYGSNQPHSNMQPYLVQSICIATVGIFPSRN